METISATKSNSRVTTAKDGAIGNPAPKKPKALKICNVANAPILPDAVMQQVHSAVAQFLNTNIWYQWGMKTYRKQGSLALLSGPPGCGKTLTARYLTQIIKRPLAMLDMGVFGSNVPGEGERQIANFFADAQDKGATVFLDEGDGVLWDRSKAGGDAMWMVSLIGKLLTELAEYRHLAIIATNRPDELDAALDSRVIAKILVTRPDYETRVRLWMHKIPKRYPVQLSVAQCQTLAQFELSGRTIESTVVKAAQNAILANTEPTFEDLCNVAKTFEHL
jgi:AAA+ superfamily predicted ATPase